MLDLVSATNQAKVFSQIITLTPTTSLSILEEFGEGIIIMNPKVFLGVAMGSSVLLGRSQAKDSIPQLS